MSTRNLRLGHPAAGRSAAHHRSARPTPTISRCRACCTPRCCAARMRMRASRSIDVSRARKRARRRGRLHGHGRRQRLQAVPCAWLAAERRTSKWPTYPCIAHDVVRYVGDIVAVVVAETPYQAYDALELIDVDYEPLPSVTDPQAAIKAGAPQLHADVPNNEAFHWTVRRRRRRRGVQERRSRRQGAHRPAAAHPERDGASRGARAVERRLGRADAVEYDAESTHPAVPLLGRHRRARRQAARDRARSRRRIRQQDRGVSRRTSSPCSAR